MATAIRHHRPYHLAVSNGDVSYPLVPMDRSRRADSHPRRPYVATRPAAHTEGSIRLPPCPDAITYPLTIPSPSPQVTSPSQACSASPTPCLRASMAFSNTTATSTWGLPTGARSPPPSRSSSPPHVENLTIDQRPVYPEGLESERDDGERITDQHSADDTHREALMNPLRPSQTSRPRTQSPDGRLDPLVGRRRPHPVFAPERQPSYRERHESWSPDIARNLLPPLRSAYPEFIEGPPRFFNTRRADTLSPPPSPSPSTSSFGTNAYSGGRTDTDPTDEDDYIKCEESVELPPLQLARPSVPQGGQSLRRLSDLDYRAPVSIVHRDSHSPIRRSPATSPLGVAPSTSPEFPFRHSARGDLEAYQTSDVRTRVVHRSDELPPLSLADSMRAMGPARLDPAPPREHSMVLLDGASIPAPATTEPVLMSPSPRKYRFVTTTPTGTGAMPQNDTTDIQLHRGRATHVAIPNGGAKRRYASTSPDSSVDAPLAGEEDGARKRGRSRQQHQQQPYDVESFVTTTATASSRRGPRGAIVPAYHYDTERALTCAFPACGSVLTGKKAETASHMRTHFLQAAGQTLYCPWPVETEDGQRVRCGMPFKDSANFGRHVSSKHIKAEEYQCNRCGRPFARRDAALRHMKTLCRVDGQVSRRRKGKGKSNNADEEQDDYVFD